MKIFIVLSESPLKVRKIAVYCFLISFLVPELLRCQDLKSARKNGTKNARSWMRSIKIEKIRDGSYKAETKGILQMIFLKKHLVVIVMVSVPGPFSGYHEMKHNSTNNHSLESIGILGPKGKTEFLVAI